MTLDQLEREFDKCWMEFVESNEGAWVLLFSNGETRFFDAEMDAIHEGFHYHRRGIRILVKQAQVEDRVITLSIQIPTTASRRKRLWRLRSDTRRHRCCPRHRSG